MESGSKRVRVASWAVAAGIALATLLAFHEVTTLEFLAWDDPAYVTENARVGAGLTRDGMVWAFTRSHSGNWHPLTWLSHMLDVELFGLDPAAHHAVNLLLHVANTLLVYVFLLGATGAPGRSAFVAAVFGLHPLHVESVAWVSERKDLLSTAFGLLTLLVWSAWVRGGSRLAYMGALALYAASLMSKPMLVTLPFLLLLLDRWPFVRISALSWRALAPLLVEKLPFLVLAGISCVVTLASQAEGISFDLPLGARLTNSVVSYGLYVRRALWPSDLAAFYPYELDPPVAILAFGAGLLLGGTAIALALLRGAPWLAVGWLWFVGLLVPVIGLVQVGMQSMADRYAYLPLVGLAIVVAWTASAVLARLPAGRVLALGLAGVTLLALGLRTRAQVPVWRDQLTLFEQALERTPDSYYALTAAGNGWVRHGDLDRAIVYFERSLALAPAFSWTYGSLGNALLLRGDTELALARLAEARALNPRLAHAAYQHGQALERVGRYPEAIAAYRAELALLPEHLGAGRRLAVLLALHPDPALREPREALRIATLLCQLTSYESATDLDVLAASLAAVGRFEEAEQMALRALERAEAEGQGALAASIPHRIERYRTRTPLRLE